MGPHNNLFADVRGIDLNLSTPLPDNDSISKRSWQPQYSVADLLANDRNWDGSALNLSTVRDAKLVVWNDGEWRVVA